ncbi:PREDICTED: auxin-induced protein 10A5-like [Tarenaya hassleriana]|uniref:auxin-induced protein 10A5-like n=1 Tax=Tarenaya hassleriana TaxID=28532 RepID=UPI00053C9AF6|nr:PREDICTED: auxin-induced protein 10A5-like [Tarenaya hassleriana]
MSFVFGKCSNIRHIVRLRHMIRRWRNKARESLAKRPVPSGHVVIIVGCRSTRYVVRLTYLNHPVFNNLLVQAAEEFGFTNHGPLTIPCDESVFEEALRFISQTEPVHSTRFKTVEDSCHVSIRREVNPWSESRPLIHASFEKAMG